MHYNIECKRLWSLCHYPVWLSWLWLWILDKSENSISNCHNCWKAKVLSLISKLSRYINWSILHSSVFSKFLQDIEKGHHDDEGCEEYRKDYKKSFGRKLPDCEYRGKKSKIQKLIRKIHIDANGSVTEIQFNNKKNDEEKSLTKLKNLFRRKWSLKMSCQLIINLYLFSK